MKRNLVMKYRPQRGSLKESMESVVEFSGSKVDLLKILRREFKDIISDDVTVKPYIYDDRIGWDTYIVLIKNNAIGFTNGPIDKFFS